MDTIKGQLRFFRILAAVLVLVVLAQFSFWFNVFSTEKTCAKDKYNKEVQRTNAPFYKERKIGAGVIHIWQVIKSGSYK